MALLAIMITNLCVMSATGAANIPGAIASVNQQYETAKNTCRMALWSDHRTKQLKKMTEMLHKDETMLIGPALQLAQSTEKNWQMTKTLAITGETLFKVNLGVLSITMIIYVLVAWMILFRKRATLNQAFTAVSGWSF